MQKLFKLLGFDQFLQQFLFRLDRQRFRVNKLFTHLCANPVFFVFALNVAVFDADFARVSLSQNLQNPP